MNITYKVFGDSSPTVLLYEHIDGVINPFESLSYFHNRSPEVELLAESLVIHHNRARIMRDHQVED